MFHEQAWLAACMLGGWAFRLTRVGRSAKPPIGYLSDLLQWAIPSLRITFVMVNMRIWRSNLKEQRLKYS